MCTGSVSLSPEDRAELLSILSTDTDENIADRAKNTLLSLPPESFITALDARMRTRTCSNIARNLLRINQESPMPG